MAFEDCALDIERIDLFYARLAIFSVRAARQLLLAGIGRRGAEHITGKAQ